MTTLYFIRHGRRGSDAPDPGLSPEGAAEAGATARALRELRVRQLVSGPLRRARETASLIGAELGLEVRIDARLRERMNWGDVPDESFDELARNFERASAERSWVPPHGDSSQGAGWRIEAVVRDVCRQERGDVVAVTHGGVLMDFVRNLLSDAELARLHAELARDPYSGEVMRECALTIVRADSSGVDVETLASAAHLS